MANKKIDYLKTITGPIVLRNGTELKRFDKINFGQGFTVETEEFKGQHNISVSQDAIANALGNLTLQTEVGDATFNFNTLPTRIVSGSTAGSNIFYEIPVDEGQNIVNFHFVFNPDITKSPEYYEGQAFLFNDGGVIVSSSFQTVLDFKEFDDNFLNPPEYRLIWWTENNTLTLKFRPASLNNTQYIIWHTVTNIS